VSGALPNEVAVVYATGETGLFFVVLVFIDGDVDTRANGRGFVEADADLEADGLERRGRDVDRQLLHLVPTGTILVVVASTFVHRERQYEVRSDVGADDDEFRLTVTSDDVSPSAGLAERLASDRGSVLDIWLAQGKSSF
jgi:hypothetical protein